MQKPPVRITEIGFKAGIGVLLGIAITLAVGRTYIRIIQARKITVDDGFFFLAVITLIAGTATCYVDIPYLYEQNNVAPGTTVITPEFIQLLLRSLRIQTAADFLFSVTLFLVKLSFLFFFHGLLRRVRGLTIWWWCVMATTVALNILFICCIFIVCPHYDASVLVKCSTPSAISKQNNLLRAAAFMDIFTDVLVISIPVALLWRVRISLRRKLILGGTLSLSIFTMIVSVVRIAGGMINGMVDPAWVNFWLQVEAAVAVMIVSITAYRSLFIMNKSSNGKSPKQQHSSTAYKKRLWSRGRQQGHEVQLPTLPNPALTGMRTVIGRAGRGAAMGSREEFFERCGRSIHVMREHEVTSAHSGEEARVHHGHDFV